MSHWTLEASGTEKTFADWGLSHLTRRLVSQAQDEVSCVADGRAFDAASLFPYGSTVTIRRDRTKQPNGTFTGGTIWFVGRRILDPRSGSGAAESNQLLFAGPWWYLDNLVYQQNWKVNQSPPGGALVAQPRSHVFLNLDDAGAIRDTAWQLNDAVAFAIAAGAPLAIDATLPSINIPVDEQRDITCAEVIRKQLRWIPDAVTWFDYTVSPPKLYIGRRGALGAASLAANGTGPIESINITRRDDLQRPAVVLKFEQINEVNGVPYHQVTEQKSPANATGLEFGALLATIQLQGFSASIARADITCTTIDAAHATDATRLTWWKNRLPKLKSDRIANLVIAANSVVRETARPRELVEGQIAPWMTFTAGEETITAKATYTLYDREASAGDKKLVAEKFEETITVRIISTDASTGSYSAWTSYTSGEPVPSGLATALYNAINAIQYDGQIVLVEEEVGGTITMGKVLNLTGGLAEWATMNALVQHVVEDVDAGRTSITIGPAGHLGPEDLVELLRVNRFRFNYTPLGARTNGIGSSGQTVLGKQTSKENSDSGGESHKRFAIIDGDTVIDIDATNKRIHITGPSGWGSIKMALTQSGTLGTGGKDVELQETNICVNGVVKKCRALISAAYD